MRQRLSRGIRRIGGWPFWIGFWTYLLYRNVKREYARAEEKAWAGAYSALHDPLEDH